MKLQWIPLSREHRSRNLHGLSQLPNPRNRGRMGVMKCGVEWMRMQIRQIVFCQLGKRCGEVLRLSREVAGKFIRLPLVSTRQGSRNGFKEEANELSQERKQNDSRGHARLLHSEPFGQFAPAE